MSSTEGQPQQPATPPAPGAPDAAISPDTLKAAMKAFRKRLKLSRLDEESKLGRSPLTTGGKSSIVAIVPPNQFPRAVWEELVKQGQLKRNGRDFYELVNP